MDRRVPLVRAVAPVLRGRESFTGSEIRRTLRVERTIGRAFAAVCLVFGAQTLPLAIEGQSMVELGWSWALAALLFAALAAAIVAGITSRFIGAAAVGVAAVFVVILISWPFAAVHVEGVLPREPWPWFLCNVATAAAAVAFSDLVATGYTLLIATAYLLVRLTPAGGELGIGRATLDSGYALIVGIGTVLIVGLLRRSAAGVDDAERAAITRYSVATRDHAAEVERTEVDAILHDSAMATLLAASRAETPADRRYAVALARTSLDVFSESTGSAPAEFVSLDEVGNRFSDICRELGVEARLVAEGLENTTVPASVAEVFFAATLQGLMNSVQHAGPGKVTRSVTARWADGRLTVTLVDDGAGFDTSTLTDRLGIRNSIVERMRSIGGWATVTSAPGEGTTVSLGWETPTGG